MVNHVTAKSTVYLDDSFVEELDFSFSSYSTDSADNFYICKAGVVADRTPSMLLDQTVVWNKALTLSEIAALFNSNNGLPYSSW